MTPGVICEYCGSPNDPRSTNCSQCGAPLPDAQSQPQAVSPPPVPAYAQPAAPMPYYYQPPMQRKGTGCAVVGCVVIALIVTLFIIGIVAQIGNSNGSPAPNTPQPLGTHAVLNLHGSASDRTSPFEVNHYWDVLWSYNCTGKAGQPTFDLRSHAVGDPESLDWKTVEHAITGSGRHHFDNAGTYWFIVKTNCRWSLKVLDNV